MYITCNIYCYIWLCSGTRSGAVGWDTELQAGRLRVWFPMGYLKIFYWHSTSAALWACGPLSLWEKWTPGVFLGVKTIGAWGRKPCHFMNRLSKMLGASTFWSPQGLSRFCRHVVEKYLCNQKYIGAAFGAKNFAFPIRLFITIVYTIYVTKSVMQGLFEKPETDLSSVSRRFLETVFRKTSTVTHYIIR